MSPDTARELKKRGFTRQSLQGYIIDKTSVRYEELSEAEIESIKRRLSEKTEAFGGTDNISGGRIPVFWQNLKPGGKIPVIVSPEHLNIFVSEDVSGYNFWSALYGRGLFHNACSIAAEVKPISMATKCFFESQNDLRKKGMELDYFR